MHARRPAAVKLCAVVTLLVASRAYAETPPPAVAQSSNREWPLQPPAEAPGAARLAEADRLLHDAEDTEENLRAAIEAYAEAVKAGLPDDVAARAWGHRALAFMRLGERAKEDERKLRLYELGTRSADEGLKRDKRSPDAWMYRGATLGRWGETQGVHKALFLVGDIRAAFENALKSDPDHLEAALALGKLDEALPRFAGGSEERAEKAFRQVLKRDPHFTRAALELAELLARNDQAKEARALCERVLAETAPSRPAEWRRYDRARAKKLLDGLD